MQHDRHQAWARISDIRLIMVIRQASADAADGAAERMIGAGIGCVEIALTTPGAAGVIRGLRERFPGVLVGAGTVLDGAAAAGSLDAGAQFLVSPGLAGSVLQAARDRDVLAIPGVQTPTETLQAIALGATALKLFPAAPLGPAYLRALRPVFPGAHFVPTGGITAATARTWFEAGAAAIGVGGAAASTSGGAAGGGSQDEVASLLHEVQAWRRESGGSP
jgi:2-dehydro-3-deoxyphosphogluconate aldolase / (4S)-4-hydroxy-2-oxoglutarate aldolase